MELAGQVARLEAIAFRSWPAAEVRAHKGMLLRAMGGESRRANSAAVYACDADLPIDEAIAVAEAFYEARGSPPRFQLTPLAPAGLEAALARRGYSIAAPVFAETAPLTAVLSAEGASGVSAEILPSPDDAWKEVEIARGRFADIGDSFLRALAGLGSASGFGVARVGGAVAGACLVVCDGGVVVLSAMRTLPELRRRGVARALVAASARWARERGADTAYLQVERDNAAALALYAAFGFTPAYAYHYRERLLAESGA